MKNQLDNVTIHAFRGLKDLELKDLGKVNVLVGDNNSGKTSVLEALSVFLNPLDLLTLAIIAKQRETTYASRKILNVKKIMWLFPVTPNKDTNLDKLIKIQGMINDQRAAYSLFAQEIQGIPKNFDPDENESNSLQTGISLKMSISSNEDDNTSEVIIWDKKPIAQRGIYKPEVKSIFISPHAHRVYGIYPGGYTEAYKSGLTEKLLELVKIFDPDIEDITILDEDNTPVLYLKHKLTGVTPIMAFGDGLRRVLYMALCLLSTKDGVLLLDEFDNSIHTSALGDTAKWLVEAARKMNVQIFATTHSLEAVDALIDASTDEELVIHHLKQGSRPPTRYSGEMARGMRYETGLDVR